MTRFDSQDLLDPLRWDHTDAYVGLGVAFAARLSRSLELCVEPMAGLSVSIFPDLLPEYGTISSTNLLLELGGRVHLNPLFNLSIDIHPSLKYRLSFSPLTDFDGLAFGLGFSASLRLGQDPDAPSAMVRSIRFDEVAFSSIFAAMQSYYADNPPGSVTFTNTDPQPVTEMQVAFMQEGYMDSPTPAAAFPEMKPGETRTVHLPASFNANVFSTEGDTPLTGEIIVSYRTRGRPAEQRQSVSYFLHDKRALRWDDDRKVAAFITPSDSALRNYTSFIRQTCRELFLRGYSEALQTGVQAFHALGEIGLLYQADAQLPFTRVQQSREVVDSVSLPRETLRNQTGDCDDLTVLFCSLLETAGIRTAFITVPGHIYAAIGTGIPARDYRCLHPDRRMTIANDGQLWVPVEVTLIGKGSFLEAWRKGVEEWAVFEGSPERRNFIPTAAAHEHYHPVGLKETDLGLQYGRKEAIRDRVRAEMERLLDIVILDRADEARRTGRKEAFNTLGVTCAQLGRYAQADEAFRRAMSMDRGYLSAALNMASLSFLLKEFVAALEGFTQVLALLEEQGQGRSDRAVKVLLNISRTYTQLQRPLQADEFRTRALAIDPAGAGEPANVAGRASGDERAAEMSDSDEILFMMEE